MHPVQGSPFPLAALAPVGKKAILMSELPSDDGARRDREQMLRDPVLRAAIERVLRERVPKADVEPLLWETLHVAHGSKNLPPPGKKRTRFVLGVARHKAMKLRRTARRRPQIADGHEVEECVARATDPVGDRDLLEKIAREIPEGHLTTLSWLARHLLGEPIIDIARENGLDYDLVYKRVTTMRKRTRTAGIRLMSGAVLVVLLAAAWSILRPKAPVALPDAPVPTERPATSTERPEPIAMDEVRALREKAFAACVKNEWRDCEEALDQAKALDPKGEIDDPRVQSARDDVEMGTRRMPGSQWKPAEPRMYSPQAP